MAERTVPTIHIGPGDGTCVCRPPLAVASATMDVELATCVPCLFGLLGAGLLQSQACAARIAHLTGGGRSSLVVKA